MHALPYWIVFLSANILFQFICLAPFLPSRSFILFILHISGPQCHGNPAQITDLVTNGTVLLIFASWISLCSSLSFPLLETPSAPVWAPLPELEKVPGWWRHRSGLGGHRWSWCFSSHRPPVLLMVRLFNVPPGWFSSILSVWSPRSSFPKRPPLSSAFLEFFLCFVPQERLLQNSVCSSDSLRPFSKKFFLMSYG